MIELASRYRVAADTDAPARPEAPAKTILPNEFRILD